jgi:hypothetical protein
MIPPVKKVLVALLYFNKCDQTFERSLHRNLDYLGKTALVDSASIKEVRGMAVDMARNAIVQYMLSEDYDAVIWPDTDMIFPDDAFARLVAMSQASHPIAAGLYRRGVGARQLLTEIEWGKPCEVDDLRAIAEGGVAKVAMTAGGFSIVRRHLYVAMWNKHEGNVPWYCNWDITGPEKQCGEDRFFVLRAKREFGISPVVDPELHAVHWPPGVSPVPVLDNDPLLELCRDYL